jgi:glutamate-1-semialdehyde 2,1-aminomutase
MTRTFDSSNKLYERALETVPLASQTFSKSSMNFVKGASPLFFERGEGPYVWDIDGNRYLDYMLGLLPIVLGYCDPDVDRAIKAQLKRGIIFSLAAPLEVELSEKLVELIPCAEMVRFGKNGSDATSAAVRLARAHTGRDKIALCGYHGWHDWCIGTTSRNLGVPQAIQDLSATFPYNDADALETLLKRHPDEFAAVILEPAGSSEPAPGFLRRLRSLCDAHGVVLIFDEIVTGFRVDMGGAQTFYDVTPDLACFGKSMANGMPISAIVGRREIMRGMEDIFFSGTFGGEALSLAAAIATINKLQETDGIPRMHRLGERLAAAITSILDDCGLSTRFAIKGVSWRPIVQPLEGEVSSVIANSLLRQELVANGIFQGAGINLCLAHDNNEIFAETLVAWRRAAETVSEAFTSNDPEQYLRGEPIQPVFQVRR